MSFPLSISSSWIPCHFCCRCVPCGLVNVCSVCQLSGISFFSKLVFQCPFEIRTFCTISLTDFLCWLLGQRFKSLSSSISLIHKTKTIPLLSASQVCENKQLSAGRATASCGFKRQAARRVGCFMNCRSIHCVPVSTDVCGYYSHF